MALREGGFDARLILVNYRDSSHNVKLILVKSISDGSIEDEYSCTVTFDKWSRWFQDFNNNKGGTTWDVLNFIRDSHP